MDFHPRSKHLLISWLQSLSTVILEPQKIKSATVSTFPPSTCHKWWDWMPWSQFFECWVLSKLFHSPLSPSSRGFSSSLLSPLEWYHLHIWDCWYFSQQSWFQLVRYRLAFLLMYFDYKLNKQGNNIQPWHNPFLSLNQSFVPCLVLTVASWPK